MSRFALVFFSALVVVCSSCRDEAAEAWARADAQHRALVAQGVAPEDKRYDAVLVELAKVPAGSKHAAAAKNLERGIVGARTTVRTPLALGTKATREPLLEAQLAACARLAQLAGVDGGVDLRTLQALEACRFKAEKLELLLSHGDEHHDSADGGGE